MHSVARVGTPGLYSLLWLPYSFPSRLFFGEEGFASETSIQQGDQIGPAFCALSVNEATRGVQPEPNVWYLGDYTLGEIPERVYDDLVALLKGPCSEGSFWGVRVVKGHELSLFNSRNYA